MKRLQDVTKYIQSLPQVQDIIVLDGGRQVLLIISTGGYSSYTPTQGIKRLTKEEATTIAGNYWHKATFIAKCMKLGKA